MYNKFWDNVNKIFSKCPRVNITFMVTYNALSVPNYHKLIDGVYQLKKDYGSSDRYWKSAIILRYFVFEISKTPNCTSFTKRMGEISLSTR